MQEWNYKRSYFRKFQILTVACLYICDQEPLNINQILLIMETYIQLTKFCVTCGSFPNVMWPKLFNKLDENISCSGNLPIFKKRLKAYFINENNFIKDFWSWSEC